MEDQERFYLKDDLQAHGTMMFWFGVGLSFAITTGFWFAVAYYLGDMLERGNL